MLVSTMMFLGSSLVIAADTAIATFSGDVSQIANIAVANQVSNLNLAGAETDVKIFDFSVQANGATGFTVNFASANQGQLHHSSYNGSKTGTFLDYTITIDEQAAGGATTLSDVTDLDLEAAKQVVYTHDDPTDGKVWDVQISHAAKTLFTGTFSDTITLTLANN